MYDIAVSGMTTGGTVIASIAAGVIDGINSASTSTDTVTYVAPTSGGQYTITGFLSPAPKSKWKAGSTVPIKVMLSLNGVRISDAAAAALLAPTCRVLFSASSTPPVPPTCMKYDAGDHQFIYTWKVADTTAASTIQITVSVKNPDSTTNAGLSDTITISK